jgi:hypothetical protein
VPGILYALALVLSASLSTPVFAAEDVPPGVSRLLDDAQVVVVGTAERSEPLWKENSRGDKVIVTRMLVRANEELKGSVDNAMWVDVEGGTIDGVTLRVSSAQILKAGDRAVLFLTRGADGTYMPQENGRGILKLDERDVVRGTTLGLDDIRQAALARAARGRQ